VSQDLARVVAGICSRHATLVAYSIFGGKELPIWCLLNLITRGCKCQALNSSRFAGFRSSGRLCREHCRTQLQVSRYREALRREHLTAEKGRKAATAKALAFAAEDTRARPSSTLSGRERRELIREARQAHRPRSAVVNGRTLSDFDRTIGDAKFTYDPAAHLKRSGSQVATKAIRRGSMSTTASSYGDGVWHSTHEQPKHGKSAFGPTASAHVSLGFGQ
jgi:hypothetical protein